MKILFITDLYPISENEKTTSTALHNFVSQWLKLGVNVDVIKPNFLLNSFIRKKPFYKTGFYDFEHVRIFNVNYFSPFLGDITKKNPDVINASKYDFIIAHMPSGLIFAQKLAERFNKPLICGVHRSDIEVLTNPLYKIYFKTRLIKAYKQAQKIACRSFVLERKLKEILPEIADKTFIAASGVSISDATENQTPKLPHFQSSVLTCANLIKRKNIDKLILAIKDSGFNLKIIGDGQELKKLKKMSSNNVEFLGRLEHKKVLKEMQKTNVFILPSIKETFGLVYLEAMTSGCIVVCTKNDGIDGIIRDGENGFLTEPTVEGIQKTLSRIKNSTNLEQIRINSLESAKEYTEEKLAQEYLKNIN